MKRLKKILSIFLIVVCCACILKNVHGATISAANSVEKGKSVHTLQFVL